MSIPAISVGLVTYNHEQFVAASIRSILHQTFGDFELVIVDDGSTDRTPEVIASFADPRIVSIRQENSGPSAATNRALAAARGKYVALMTGDDLSAPHRLQRQLEQYQRGGSRLLFSDCEFIDDHSQPLTGPHFATGAFDTSPRTQAQLLRRLFDGNFINGVTAFTETSLFREIGPFDPAVYQLQDYQMWIRFTKKYALEFVREALLRYRIRGDGGNLSTPTPAACNCHHNEMYLIMKAFFDDIPDELFREAFRDDLRRPDLNSPAANRCEQAFLFLNLARPELVYAGLERFQALYREAETATLLSREFNYPPSAMVKFMKAFDPFGRYRDQATNVYVDTGAGYNEAQRITISTTHVPHFQLRFDLSAYPNVKAVRWDPVENRCCRVRLNRVAWTDGAGQVHNIDPAAVVTNGSSDRDGWRSFETTDPIFLFPASGDVLTLHVEGTWSIDDPQSSIVRTCQRAQRTEQEMRERIVGLERDLARLQARDAVVWKDSTALRRERKRLVKDQDALLEQHGRSFDRRLHDWLHRRLPRGAGRISRLLRLEARPPDRAGPVQT
jgi:glycosyltransferase involved in cell wall biosynthesis